MARGPRRGRRNDDVGGGIGRRHVLDGFGEGDDGQMLGALGGVGGLRVGVEFGAGGLEALQRALGALGLAHHGGGLVAALGGGFRVGGLVELGEALAMLPVFGGGDELGGEFGLGVVGRAKGRDAGDDRVIAEGAGFGLVVGERREAEAEGTDHVVHGIRGEFVGEFVGGDVEGHGWAGGVSGSD